MTHHYAKTAQLIEQYNMTLKANEKSLNSQGSAYKENEKYLQSTTAKIQQLKVQFEKLATSFMNTDFLKGLIAIGSGAVSVVQAFGNLKTILAVIGTMFAVWKGTEILKFFKAMPGSIKTTIISMQLYKDVSFAIQQQQAGMLTMNQAVSLSFHSLGMSIKAAFMSNPLGWIAVGITSVIMAIDAFNNKQEELKQKSRQLIEDVVSLSDKIKEANKNYEDANDLLEDQAYILSKGNVKQTADDKQRLYDIEAKLAQIIPEATTSYDNQNTALATNLELTQQLAKAKRDEALSAAFTTMGKLNPDDEVAKLKSFKQTLQDIQSLQKGVMNDKETRWSAWQQTADANGYSAGGKTVIATKSQLDLNKIYYNESLSKETKEALKNAETQEQVVQALSLAMGELSKQFNEGQKAVNSYNSAAKLLVDSGYKNVKTNEDEILSQSAFSDELVGATNKVKDDTNATNENTDAHNDNIDSISEQAKKAKELSETYNKSIDTIGELNKLQDELKENHMLSADSIGLILEKYPELEAHIGNEANLKNALTQAIENEKNVALNAYKEKMMASNDYYKNEINGAQAVLDALEKQGIDKAKLGQIDLKNAQNLAEARAKVEAALINNMAQMWANYYSAVVSAAEKANTTMYDSYKYVIMGGGGTPEQQQKYQEGVNASASIIGEYSKIASAFNNITAKIDIPNFDKALSSDFGKGAGKEAEKAQKEAEQMLDDAYQVIDEMNDKIMDAIKKQIEAEKKALDERLDNYKKFIDDKMKALNDSYAAEDRKRKLAEEAKKKAELEAQRNELLVDISPEANARKHDLEKQIQDQQQVLDDLNRDYGREDRKTNLEKQLEEYEKNIEAQKQAIDNKYADAEIAKMAKNGLATGLVNIGNQTISVKQLLIDAMEKSGEAFESTGKKLQIELIDRLEKAARLMQSMNSNGTISVGTATQVMGSHKSGGVVDYQGLAMLHGSTSNPEVVFNSSQASKLFNFVKNLPNIAMPNLPNILPINGGGIQVHFDNLIGNVQGSVDRSILPILDRYMREEVPNIVAEAQMNNNKKLGSFRPNMA